MRQKFDRNFQLWEYFVSHGSLLVRSPASPAEATNVDLVFAGVAFVSLPRYLPQLAVDDATPEEIADCAARCGERFNGERVWVLETGGVRHFVVALAMNVSEHDDDIFVSPFEFGPTRRPSGP